MKLNLDRDIGNGVSLENVDIFCYLVGMLDVDKDVIQQQQPVRSAAWKKFRKF